MYSERKETYIINGQKLHVKRIGSGIPVVLLLGWMADIDHFPFKKTLKNSTRFLDKYEIIVPHLSNFYNSDFSKKIMSLEEYSQELETLLNEMGMKKIFLIGHSAGGKFAMKYTFDHPEKVFKLALLDTAGLSLKNPPKRLVSFAHFSFSKYFAFGKNKEFIQQQFIKIFKSNVLDFIEKIKTPTLIIWGQKDKTIQLKSGLRIHEYIEGSKLKIFEEFGHMTIHQPEVFKFILDFFDEK